jgi:putative ubiquitin-RnfH superfamily antitoxin RatB of RatAB toxin-antitoxin module
MLRVELACALPDQVWRIMLEVSEGTTVADIIERSGLQQIHPELFPLTDNIGIFGKLCQQDTPVRDGDRVEIYRPLLADPKEARRNRAKRRAQH